MTILWQPGGRVINLRISQPEKLWGWCADADADADANNHTISFFSALPGPMPTPTPSLIPTAVGVGVGIACQNVSGWHADADADDSCHCRRCQYQRNQKFTQYSIDWRFKKLGRKKVSLKNGLSLFLTKTMANPLQAAMNFQFNLNLWPESFVEGCALVAAKRRLNIDSVLLSLILGTSAFVGKSQVRLDGSDKVDVASIWVCNIQVNKDWFFTRTLVSPMLTLT